MDYVFDIKELKIRNNTVNKLLVKNFILNKGIPNYLKWEKGNLRAILEYIGKDNIVLPECNCNHKHGDSRLLPKLIIEDYLTIDKNFRKVIFDVIKNIDIFEDEVIEIECPKFYVTNEELIEMGHDLYKNLPTKNDRYLKSYLKYTDPKEHCLTFVDFDEEVEGTFGITYPVYHPTYKPYIFVFRENDINDLISLSHEVAHGIFYQPNSNGKCKRIMELEELEGQWFNYLSLDYARNKLKMDNIDAMELNCFTTAFDYFYGLLITSICIKLFKEKREINFDRVNKLLRKNDIDISINNEIIDITFNVLPSERIRYFSSFLIETDLEKMYQTDKEKAFWCFEKIQEFKNYQDLNNLEKYGITCFEDGYQTLKEKIKRMTLIQEKNMDTPK